MPPPPPRGLSSRGVRPCRYRRITRRGRCSGWEATAGWAGDAPLARVADLFRQVGCDELVHKEDSLAHLGELRFR